MQEIKFEYIFISKNNWIEKRTFTLKEIEDGRPNEFMEYTFVHTNNIIRRQCVWIKDIKWFDVCDWDIIQWKHPKYDLEFQKWEVFYSDEDAWFMRYNHLDETTHNPKYYKKYFSALWEAITTIEIIWNIYEK